MLVQNVVGQTRCIMRNEKMAFLSNLHQPEVGILNSWAALLPKLLSNHLYHGNSLTFG